MSKYDIKNTLYISDLDGTLLPRHGVVNEADIAAAKEFMAAGGRFALATGRMPDMLDWAVKMGVNAPCIIANGAVIYDMNTDKILYERFLDPIAATAIPDVMDKFPGLCLQQRVLDKLFVSRPNAQFEWHISWELQKYSLVNYKDGVYNCHKMLLLEEHETLLKAREYLSKTYPGAFDYVFSCDVFLEVIPHGCTKGDAIPKLLEIMGMEKAVVLATGDYGNDVTMLRKADVSGCPSTAIDEVKAISDYVLCPVGEGVAADFLKRLYHDDVINL